MKNDDYFEVRERINALHHAGQALEFNLKVLKTESMTDIDLADRCHAMMEQLKHVEPGNLISAVTQQKVTRKICGVHYYVSTMGYNAEYQYFSLGLVSIGTETIQAIECSRAYAAGIYVSLLEIIEEQSRANGA